MSGKPRELYVDNAAKFKSEVVRRGCDQHGIGLRYRPPGQPHFGGIVERLIGTMMRLVHELPGTTFSNTGARGTYDSDGKAVLTVQELQCWLALAVVCYHGQVHDTLGRTPAGVWAVKVAEAGSPMTVTVEAAFLVNFLPVIRQTLSRSGFVIDHVQYYCDALKSWIACRERLGRFVLRRDPRDISRVWALDPEGAAYPEVRYRTLSQPRVSRACRALPRSPDRDRMVEVVRATEVPQSRWSPPRHALTGDPTLPGPLKPTGFRLVGARSASAGLPASPQLRGRAVPV